MEECFDKEKIKILEMQAKYLRYLASLYQTQPILHESPLSSNYSSLSPLRSSRDNPYDDLPIRKAQKPFEELIEEKLRETPSLMSTNNESSKAHTLNSPSNKFLKRGEGHLSTLTRSFSSSILKNIRNKFLNKESLLNNNIQLELAKIKFMKKQLEEKNEKLKKEKKEILRKKKIELEEIQKIRIEKSKERPCSSDKEEIENLRKRVQKMMENDRLKDLKHQEEIKKLNNEIVKLKKKIDDIGQTNQKKQKLTPIKFNESITTRSLKVSPQKSKVDTQGKIKRYIDKSNQFASKNPRPNFNF